MTWRLGRTRDASTATSALRYTFTARRRPAWSSPASSAVPGDREPVWLLPGLEVRRGPRTLVAAGRRPSRSGSSGCSRQAVTAVERVLPRWHGDLVAYAPASLREFAASSGPARAQYRGIAAVTTTVDGSPTPARPTAIVVNPGVFDGLGPVGAHVVITHEATHAATGAATVSMPLWVAEGFADYVGIGSVDLPVAVAAKAALSVVRRSGAPATLPDDAAFAVDGADLEATYEEAWLATSLIARTYGRPRLVAFYRAVEAHPDDLDGAFERILHTSRRGVHRVLAEPIWRRPPVAADQPGKAAGGHQRLPAATGRDRVVRVLAVRGSARRRGRLHGPDEGLRGGRPAARLPGRARPLPHAAADAGGSPRAVRAVAREHGCDRVLFGASMPLGLLAGPAARRPVSAGSSALTHGHEVWWAAVPARGSLLRRVGREVDVLTYVSDYCRERIARALRPEDARSMVRLSPGVDPDVFTPDRRRVGRCEIVSASRPTSRWSSRPRGWSPARVRTSCSQAWPAVLAAHPRAVLLIVGERPGPPPARAGRGRARRSPARSGWSPGVGWDGHARPCTPPETSSPCPAGPGSAVSSRRRSASCSSRPPRPGCPSSSGDSGGAPETVVDGETGYVVDPRSAREVADRIICARSPTRWRRRRWAGADASG